MCLNSVSRETVAQAVCDGEETKRRGGRRGRKACRVKGEVTHSQPSSLTLVAP